MVSAGNYTFVAYPFSGGVMLLEIGNGAGFTSGISAGNIYPQTATSLASSQGYGLNLSGANSNGEVDMIGEFTANGDAMSGLYVNNSGLLGRTVENLMHSYWVASAMSGKPTWGVRCVISKRRNTMCFSTRYYSNSSLAPEFCCASVLGSLSVRMRNTRWCLRSSF